MKTHASHSAPENSIPSSCIETEAAALASYAVSGFQKKRLRRSATSSAHSDPRGNDCLEASGPATGGESACSFYAASASSSSLVGEAIYIGTEHAWRTILTTFAECHVDFADHVAVNRLALTYFRRMPYYLHCAEQVLRAELRDEDEIDDTVRLFMLRVAIEFGRDDSAIWSDCEKRGGSVAEKYMLGFTGEEIARRLRRRPTRLRDHELWESQQP